MRIENKSTTMLVNVIKDFKFPLLIGSDYLHILGIVLNYERKYCRWGELVLPMTPSQIPDPLTGVCIYEVSTRQKFKNTNKQPSIEKSQIHETYVLPETEAPEVTAQLQPGTPASHETLTNIKPSLVNKIQSTWSTMKSKLKFKGTKSRIPDSHSNKLKELSLAKDLTSQNKSQNLQKERGEQSKFLNEENLIHSDPFPTTSKVPIKTKTIASLSKPEIQQKTNEYYIRIPIQNQPSNTINTKTEETKSKKMIQLQLGSIFNIEHQVQEGIEDTKEEMISYSPEWQRIAIAQNENIVLNTEEGNPNTSDDQQLTTQEEDQINDIQITPTLIKNDTLITKILKHKLKNNWNDTTHKLIIQVISNINEKIPANEFHQLSELIIEFNDVFARDNTLKLINCCKHYIKLKPDAKLCRKMPYRRTPEEEEFIEKTIKELLESGRIRPSDSCTSSNITVVHSGHYSGPGQKRTFRFCVDFRHLNSQTEPDNFPIARIDSCLDFVSERTKYMSVLDCKYGFWSLELHESSKWLSAFSSKIGLFEFNVAPFGLIGSPASYLRCIASVLNTILWRHCVAYMDDIIVCHSAFDQHLIGLREVFQRFRNANISLAPNKCTFAQQETKILGHIINQTGYTPDPYKTKAISEIPIPATVKQVMSFLSTANFYRKFIKNMSTISGPLNLLLKKDEPFRWGAEQQEAFEKIKYILTHEPLLTFFRPDRQTRIYTDASKYGYGVMLTQIDESGQVRPIQYYSGTWNPTQKTWSTIEWEYFAIVMACTIFYPYVANIQVEIYSDHKPLSCEKFTQKIGNRLGKWSMILQGFNLKLKYYPGKLNTVSDYLSRYPIEQVYPESEILEIPALYTEINDILELQTLDPDCIIIKQNIANTKNYILDKGILFYVKSGLKRLVLPRVILKEILTDYHSRPISGHLGYSRIYHKLSQRYHWLKMKTDIYNFIKSCPECISYKQRYGKKHGLMGNLPIPQRPFSQICTDILGPLPMSRRGNKYIITASCMLIKYIEIRAIKNATTEEILAFFEEQIYTRYGCPDIIHSDNGSQYISQLYEASARLYKIEPRRITFYNSPANGIAERLNSTLHSMICKYVNSNSNNWDEELHNLAFAYNSTPHASHKYTPFYLLYGREPVFPSQFKIEEAPPLIECKGQNLETIWKLISKSLKDKQEKIKHIEDKHRREVQYQVGEKVKLTFPRIPRPGQPVKWTKRYYGEYQILKKYSDLIYQVQDTTTSRTFNVHIKRMRPILQQIETEDEDQEFLFQTLNELWDELQDPESIIKELQTSEVIPITNNKFEKIIYSKYFPYQIIIPNLNLNDEHIYGCINHYAPNHIILIGIWPSQHIKILGKYPSTNYASKTLHTHNCTIHFLSQPISYDSISKLLNHKLKNKIMIIGDTWEECIYKIVVMASIKNDLYPSIYRLVTIIESYTINHTFRKALNRIIHETHQILKTKLDRMSLDLLENESESNEAQKESLDTSQNVTEKENLLKDQESIIDSQLLNDNEEFSKPLPLRTRVGRIIKLPSKYKDFET